MKSSQSRRSPAHWPARIAVFAVLVAALVAVGALGAAAQTPKDMFSIAIDREPVTFDPAVCYELPSQSVVLNVYETLVEYRDGDISKVYPALAESWTISKDGKTYTFKIRKGVKFHDGTPLTAEDVKYSMDRAAAMNQGGAFLIRDFVDHIKVVDPYTVQIVLQKPFSGYLSVLTFSTNAIISKKWSEAHGGYQEGKVADYFTDHTNGTGPYKFVRWNKGQNVILERNDNYWRKPGAFKRIIVQVVPEPTTRALMLKKGEVDMINIEPINMNLVQGAKGVALDTLPSMVTSWIVINQAAWPLGELAVRKALIAAFPYKTVLDVVFKGLAAPLSQLLAPGLLGYDKTVPNPKQDLEAAKKILADAGWKDTNGDGILDKDGKPLDIEYNYPDSKEERKNIGVIFQAELAKIGVKLNVVGLSWPALIAKGQANKTALVATGWSPDFADPDNYIGFALTTGGLTTMSSTNNNDPEIDKLVEAARVEQSDAKRAELYKKITRLALADATHILVSNPQYLNARRNNIVGYTYDPMSPDVRFYGLSKK